MKKRTVIHTQHTAFGDRTITSTSFSPINPMGMPTNMGAHATLINGVPVGQHPMMPMGMPAGFGVPVGQHPMMPMQFGGMPMPRGHGSHVTVIHSSGLPSAQVFNPTCALCRAHAPHVHM